MNWGFIAVSGVLVLLGLVCLWFWHKFREEVAVMAATPTSRAVDVKTLAPGSVVVFPQGDPHVLAVIETAMASGPGL